MAKPNLSDAQIAAVSAVKKSVSGRGRKHGTHSNPSQKGVGLRIVRNKRNHVARELAKSMRPGRKNAI